MKLNYVKKLQTKNENAATVVDYTRQTTFSVHYTNSTGSEKFQL